MLLLRQMTGFLLKKFCLLLPPFRFQKRGRVFLLRASQQLQTKRCLLQCACIKCALALRRRLQRLCTLHSRADYITLSPVPTSVYFLNRQNLAKLCRQGNFRYDAKFALPLLLQLIRINTRIFH